MLMENDAFIENMESLEYLDLMDGVIENNTYLSDEIIKKYRFAFYKTKE